MTDTGGTDDLARRKAEAEIAKLEAEAAKARREGRGIGPRIGVVVSVATVLTSLTIGGSQVWIAREKSESDRRLAEIDLGLKTAGFVLERRERFLAAPPEGQVAFVGLVVHLFPPADARRLLAQLGQDLASQAASIAAICSALGRLGEAGAESAAVLRCTGEPAPMAVAAGPEPPAVLAARRDAEAMERRAAAQATAADPCASLPEPTERDLRVFPHVTARPDRVFVQERIDLLAQGIGWPVAGVEFVDIRWTRPDGEVRYYFPDQCRLAVQLSERFERALRTTGLREPPRLSVRYIGINYRNLPRGRIEVWLPPLAP
ncbi:hypothetical protein [Elioraea tepidiphila]|jgi:hypothetical protein|uniref:hypothetical protein n=1 Tax=Elioraea tepidiphila TaxID=457934 RepID=UPI00035F05B8|nr:hypothetical protein [Elioraea tepidiphila]